MNSLLKKYQTKIVPELKKDLKLKNVMAVPKVLKIVVNMGLNDAVGNKGIIDKARKQIETIAGQKASVTKARKSISAFKLRKGMPMGLKVTLRGIRMFDFLEKIVKIVLPRQRDFKGISEKGFDGLGNLNIGFKEQTIFPDIEYDQIDRPRGIEVTIVTSSAKNEQARVLLEKIGIPFKKEQ
jgi:large subunit ribosomal protein L5